MRFALVSVIAGLLFAACLSAQAPSAKVGPAAAQPQASAQALASGPIRFTFLPIDFHLDSSESAERHAPETMAGGVAVFDYNNDGKLDIFFANGADIHTLQKSEPKYWNRL
ncbi:MAG TPA: hypothetical protein VHL05_11275, partial [Terriglobales bacterium]|nr:hypothetical protein [Terriglobales bacterium]